MLPPERPLASATGTLDKRPLAHLLVYALERGLTGTMEIVAPKGGDASLTGGSFVLVEGHPQKVRASNQTDPAADPAAALARMDALFELPTESTFAYYDAFDALPGEPSYPMEALTLVWRGIKRSPSWEHVHALLTRIGGAALSLSAPAAEEVLTRFALDETERRFVERLVAIPSPMHDLVNAEILPAGRAQLLAYCLVITKKAEVTAVNLATPSSPGVIAAAPSRPDASPPEPPSGVPIPSAAPSAPASSSAVARLRLSRTSAQPGFREEKPRISPADPRRSVTPPPVAAVDAAMVAQIARRAEIVARARAIDTEDYFTMLALPRDATNQQIQTAFFALAKTWHPDRLPSTLADVKDECSRVFARMSEAHQTLSDNDRRARYMRLLTEGGATPKDQETIAAVVEASTCFQKAEIFMKRGDVVQAELLCRKATKLDPDQADYHALLAWLEAMKPENQNPQETRTRIDRLGEAIARNLRCERAFFYRGQLYKRLNDEGSAVADFRQAAELNPRNVDAQREVRLYTMRASSGATKPKTSPEASAPAPGAKPDKAKSGGFLNRLFKK
jgi:tetratricopeptide (TPR) repeat protein